MLLEQSDGKVRSATLAPGVNSPILRPAFDWDCLGECVARFARQVQGPASSPSCTGRSACSTAVGQD